MASSDYRPAAPKLQEQDLKGKVALVTGATKGIGRATALELATRGASILGTYSTPESAHNFDTLSHTITDLYSSPSLPSHLTSSTTPKFHGVAANITSLPSIGEVISALETHFPQKLDILVLNASFNARPRLGAASASDITSSLTGNLHWPIVLMEYLVRKKLFNANARVVVISSDRVRDPAPGSSIFNATKAGLEALARAWAVELPISFPGSTVNAVSVGLTDTPGLRVFPAAAVEALKGQRVPKVKVVEGGRMGYPEDVADVVGWLCSEKSRWQSGSVVAANGGAEYVGGSG
ncbi:hypothetical protein BCR34DRAFT_556525 [Clohesyomyces aquaticus]|uniref:NAD(P)-binding protein n=1 Tax=Clohesyomyces aquaticus TaxID=1231657 RepID=A0A1Y2A2Q1_9PLEO|nr:hypothetical protein BCR34DRAFT_556525 [Clohesyomyces aquaticus]